MATEEQIAQAIKAAIAVFEQAGFAIEDGEAWAEPGDMGVQGVNLRDVVVAVLPASETQNTPAAPKDDGLGRV